MPFTNRKPTAILDKTLGIETPIFIATNRIHNLIHVRTSDKEALSEIAALIRTSDRATPQVLLETKIIRITDINQSSFGLDFEFDDGVPRNDLFNNNSRSVADIAGGFYEYYSEYIISLK